MISQAVESLGKRIRLSKSRADREIAGQERLRAGRERALALQVEQWLRRSTQRMLRERLAQGVSKASGDDADLARMLATFGLAQAQRIGNEVVDQEWVMGPSLRAEIIADKDVKVQDISAATRRMIEDIVQRILTDASTEQPRPTAQEIARRIRAEVANSEIVSPERATLIARTELAQTENSAIEAAAREVGIKEFEWLARTDGKSGDRHHERMDGVRIRAGEKFTTPLGNKLRYPGDPRAPIKETANCRCVLRPVR